MLEPKIEMSTQFSLLLLLGGRRQRSPQFGSLLGIISNNGGSRAVPLPSNNPRTGRTGKLRASHFGLRHQNPLRRTRQKPSFNGGRFLSDNSLSRNIAFHSNGGHGVSSTGVRRNKISSQGYGDKFRPSIKLPSTFVTISHPVATVASLQTPTPSTNNYISSTTSLPPLITASLITGRPIQFTSVPVYSNVSVGGRNSYNTPSRSYPSATVTGRPSTPSINNNKNIVNIQKQ